MFSFYSDPPELFIRVADYAFDILSLSGDAVIECEFISKEEIRSANQKARNVDSATDVLSFPMLSEVKAFTRSNYPYDYDEQAGGVAIGSILICREVATSQAAEYGHTVEREEAYLFLHGLLHLLGYDHTRDDETRIMRETEERILSALSINR